MSNPAPDLVAAFPSVLRDALTSLAPGQYLYFRWLPLDQYTGRLGSPYSGRLDYSEALADQPEIAFLALPRVNQWPGGYGSLRMQLKGDSGADGAHKTVWLMLPPTPAPGGAEARAEEGGGDDDDREAWLQAAELANDLLENARGLMVEWRQARKEGFAMRAAEAGFPPKEPKTE